MAVSSHGDRLDQFEEGDAAGGHAGEVEGIPYSAVSPTMIAPTMIRTPEAEW
jgi:hypothetical protein